MVRCLRMFRWWSEAISSLAGSVFFVSGSFSFEQAANACKRQEARLALVGQLYAAWHFQKYDQCDGGWLSDGSVRFPISFPRERCGGIPEASVRSFGFPDKSSSVYGAYCYRQWHTKMNRSQIIIRKQKFTICDLLTWGLKVLKSIIVI